MLFVDSGVNKVCCCCNVMVLYLRMIINLKNIYTNIFPKFMVRSLVFFLGGGGRGGGNSNKTIHPACVIRKYNSGEHAQPKFSCCSVYKYCY